jgi:hypothetical protein
MDTNTGTIMQFQNDEEMKKAKESLKKLQAENPLIGKLIELGRLPKTDCELCGGTGAVQSKITSKWIPCVCTNPKPNQG